METKAVGRREMHLRRIEMRAYARDGGLWDVLLVGPNVRHERRAKGREAAFGTSARWRG